jgi:hypothetical protein
MGGGAVRVGAFHVGAFHVGAFQWVRAFSGYAPLVGTRLQWVRT